jgi:nucleotide-binding universal stress UspA family protein
MFKNILIGVDEHQGGRDAVALGHRLLAHGGTLTLAHIYPSELHPWRGSNTAYESITRKDAGTLLEAVRAELDLEAELRSLGAPSVGRGLHVLAERIDADLLVVGTSHRSLLGRVWVGDDTRAALNGSACAVAIAPIGYATESDVMREIGVGYDGSPESIHALAVARRLAAETGARLSAFEAVALPSYAYAGAPPVTEATIDDLVEQARDHVAELDGVEPHASYGQAAEELAAYSASLDLLVVGSRSYGPAGRLVHGSTSHHLARTARCPLLVMTRAAGDREPLPGLDQPMLEGITHEVGAGSEP